MEKVILVDEGDAAGRSGPTEFFVISCASHVIGSIIQSKIQIRQGRCSCNCAVERRGGRCDLKATICTTTRLTPVAVQVGNANVNSRSHSQRSPNSKGHTPHTRSLSDVALFHRHASSRSERQVQRLLLLLLAVASHRSRHKMQILSAASR